MCPRRVLPHPVPQPAHPIRQTPPATTIPPNRLVASHRTAILCEARGQNAHRDAHQGHVAERQLFQLALHATAVTPAVAASGVDRHWLSYLVNKLTLETSQVRLGVCPPLAELR